EMDTPLLLQRQAGEERIHQHRFAAADAAMDVKPFRRLRRGLAEADAREETAAIGGPVIFQLLPEALQPLRRAFLVPIGIELARGEPRIEERERPFRCIVLVSE